MSTKFQIKFHARWRHVRSIFYAIFCSFALVACASDGPANNAALERVSQIAAQRYGSAAVAATRDWFGLIQSAKQESNSKKLKTVNDFVNRRLRFDTDTNVWGKTDYWATPIETFSRRAGDCEDYAIAKYFSLKFSDVPSSKLRITYVKASFGGLHSDLSQAHMVLAYYETPDAEPLILDNLIGEVWSASRRTDLTPIFGFNSDGVWQNGSKTPQPGGVGRVSKWAELLEKMKSESFE